MEHTDERMRADAAAKTAWNVDASTVGRTIAEGRRALGLTQESMAQRLGVTKAAVSKWEQAASLPDISLLPGIASLLDLTVDELLGWNPQLNEEEIATMVQALREGFEHDAAGTFSRAQRIAASHWNCWQALVNIASEILYATRIPAKGEADRIAPAGTTPLPVELARAMLDECIAICEHVERDSRDAAIANLAVSTHAAALIRRKDDPQAIIDFVEPYMQPAPPLGGKPGLASLYLLAGKRDRASKLVRASMTEAIAELNQATAIWMSEKPEAEQIIACVDAFAAVARAYGSATDTPQLAVLIPTTRLSSAATLFGQGELEAALEQLERAADELEALDAESLAGSPSFEGSPVVIARAICTPEAWGELADDPRYQGVVSRLGETFEL